MCGITGILRFDKYRIVDNNILKKMTDTIYHRGPDGEGFYVNSNVGLGHRRLSIIDLETGDQPMFSDDKQLVLVFNGEIYNYLELQEELKDFGYQFKTNSDTEVVIKAYEKWGYECQNKFNGMWAFALWDNRKKELFLSRDRIGEKPLHYAVWDNSFIFASEIKAIFAYGVPKIFRSELIELYLFLANIPEPNSFYKYIYKLLPGHYMIIKDGNIKEKKYWDLPEIDEKNMIKNKMEVYEKFKILLKDAIKIRMRSDVPYGAFLSGGLDSSSVIAIMSEISEFPVKTFTIGFEHKTFDESKLAQKVAEKFATEHYRGTVTTQEFDEVLEKIVFYYDEPFGDPSAIPTGHVSKFAREKVKMVLTGDGGDELLSGYTSYQGVKIAQIYQKFPVLFRYTIPHIINFVKKLFKGSLRYNFDRISNILYSSNLDFNIRSIHKIAYIEYAKIKNLTKNIKNKIKIEDYIYFLMKNCHYKDDFYRLMYLNYKHDLPNDYLTKVDRMSMAYSLETRLPFLDYRLIEYMVHVDKEVKMEGFERKTVLRKTIGKKLPKEILKAPKKGFNVPIREWFKRNNIGTYLTNFNNLKEFLDVELINELVKENKYGLSDNGNFLWQLIVLNKIMDN